jgi:ABC-type sugar transport system substrate-binding protein
MNSKTINKITVLLLVVVMGAMFISHSIAEAAASGAASLVENSDENPFSFDRVKGDDQKKHTVAFSNSFVTNVFRSLCNAAFIQACEVLNINGIIVDGQADLNKQISDIENLVAQGVDAIVTIPYGDAVGSVLQEARKKGVFVITACTPITNNPDAYDVYMGADLVAGTEAYTREMLNHIGGKGNIVMILGNPGETLAELFKETALRVIKEEYPGINVLDMQYANSKEDEGKMLMTNWLLAYPNQIDAVWSGSAQSTVGAIKAYLDLGQPLVSFTGSSSYNALFKLYMENKDANPDFYFALSPTSTTTSVSDAVRLLYKMWYEDFVPKKEEMYKGRLMTSAECEKYVLMDAADAMYVDHDLTPENLQKFLNIN